MNHCFDPRYELSAALFNLMYICNLTDDDSFGMIVAEIARLLKVVPAYEFTNKNLAVM